MKWSYWEYVSCFKDIDFLIIGSGFVGMFSALEIKRKKPNAKVIILERSSISAGASTKNAGFSCFGSLSEILADLENMPNEKVFSLLKMRYDGLKRMTKIVEPQLIEFDPCGGYEIFKEEDVVLFERCKNAMFDINQKLKKLLSIKDNVFDIVTNDMAGLGLKNIHGIIKNKYEGSIHTGKLFFKLKSLVKEAGIDVYNGVDVVKYDIINDKPFVEISGDRKIHADKIIIATNAFARDLNHNLEIVPVRNQVMVTKPIPNLKMKGTFHYDEGFIYFRNVDSDRILIGGARNQDLVRSNTHQFGGNNKLQSILKEFIKDTVLDIPNVIEIEYEWSGILAMHKDKSPIIEKLDNKIIFAVRMGGMGVAISSEIGLRVAEMID